MFANAHYAAVYLPKDKAKRFTIQGDPKSKVATSSCYEIANFDLGHTLCYFHQIEARSSSEKKYLLV